MVVKIPKTRKQEKFTVVKSMSFDFDLINLIRNESEIMGKTFSETASTLLRIGISVRRNEREEDRRKDAEINYRNGQQYLTNEEKDLLGGENRVGDRN
jgi:hypothetical protein